MQNRYNHTKQQTSILKTTEMGNLTPISTKTRKQSSKKRNHSQDSVIQELLNIRSKSHHKEQQPKKKSRSKSNNKKLHGSKKKQVSKVPLEITVLRANGSNSRLNVTAYVPSSRNHHKKDRKQQSLSASHTSKNKRIHIKRSITDESDSSTSPNSIRLEKKNSHSVRKSGLSLKKQSLTEDDQQQISQEFHIDTIKQQPKTELQNTREQLAHYRQLVYELKKQLEAMDSLQKKIQDEHQRSDHFIARSHKYKAMAKTYKGELKQAQQGLESEKTQKIIAIEREQSSIRIGDTIMKQQRLIINEMVLSLQRMQATVRAMDDNGDLQKQVNEIFCLLSTFHNITNIHSKNISQGDHTFSEFTNEQHQALMSGFNSDQLGFTHNSEGTYLNTERIENLPCSQTQMLSYSIFSPKFMVSSDRGNGNQISQTFSQTTQQHPTQGPCINDSSAIENFTLTYDQNNNQHNHTQTTNQSGENQQIDLLLKVQQEIIQMREQQSELADENRRLKEVNEKVIRGQEQMDMLMRDKIQLMLNENAKLRDERDTAVRQMQELANIQTVVVRKSDQNSSNRSHDDTLDLHQYVQSKKGSSSVHQKYNSSGASSSDQDDVSLATYNQPYIITQENQQQQTNMINQRPSQASIESLSQSLNRSRFQRAGVLPLRSNSRGSVNQDPTIQKTFDNERDQLFSLSSTQPGDLTPVDKRDKENIAPRYLDFNQNQMIIPRNTAVVFQLVHPEIINHNESCQTQKPTKSDIIKVEDTIGQYSHDVTTNRANNSYYKSLAHLSLTQQEQKVKTIQDNCDPTHNTRTYTQESEKPPLSEMRSSASSKEYRNNNQMNFSRTQYQQLNYTDSDQSFDRHRYSNFDSKNVTQQLPTIMQQEKEEKQFVEDQMFSKATTNKNTSRQALLGVQVLNKDSSTEQLMPMRQIILEKQANSSQFISKREESLNHNGSALQDFKNQMFNNTGILSHQTSNQGPISTQGDIQERQNTVTSNQSACVRTLNLKKEISTLDQEILLLQQSLKHALHTKKPLVE